MITSSRLEPTGPDADCSADSDVGGLYKGRAVVKKSSCADVVVELAGGGRILASLTLGEDATRFDDELVGTDPVGLLLLDWRDFLESDRGATGGGTRLDWVVFPTSSDDLSVLDGRSLDTVDLGAGIGRNLTDLAGEASHRALSYQVMFIIISASLNIVWFVVIFPNCTYECCLLTFNDCSYEI